MAQTENSEKQNSQETVCVKLEPAWPQDIEGDSNDALTTPLMVVVKQELNDDDEALHGEGLLHETSWDGDVSPIQETQIKDDPVTEENGSIPILQSSIHQELSVNITGDPETFPSSNQKVRRKQFSCSCGNTEKDNCPSCSLSAVSSNFTKLCKVKLLEGKLGGKKRKKCETQQAKSNTAPKRRKSESFECALCEKSYKTLKMLDVHKQKIHGWVLSKSASPPKVGNNRKIEPTPTEQRENYGRTGAGEMLGKDAQNESGRVKCNECDKYYKTNKILGVHRRKVHGWIVDKAELPKVDRKSLEMKSDPQIRAKTTRSEVSTKDVRRVPGGVKCDECEKFCKNVMLLEVHKQKFHGIYVDECLLLGQSGKNLLVKSASQERRENSLQNVLMEKGNALQVAADVKCDVCQMSFRTVKELEIHKSSAHCWAERDDDDDEFDLQCAYCDKLFDTKTKLGNHRYKCKYRGANFRIQCDFCDEKFDDRTELRTHESAHRKIFVHKCKVCKAKLPTADELQSHIKGKHGLEKPFQCKECGKSFSQRYHLREHMVTHAEIRPFMCKICGKDFAHSRSFSRHLQSHETNLKVDIVLERDRNLKCTYCSEVFKDKTNWHKHVLTHREYYKYDCPHCSKTYASNETLVRHMKQHMGKKPHECGECGKRFYRQTHLQYHERTHTGEKPFNCKLCGKAFARLDLLKGHDKRIHKLGKKSRQRLEGVREAKYQCRFKGCKERFVHTGQRIRHEKKAHPVANKQTA